ncbi:MAG TPA: hypothetical protein DEA08_04695 [Planctomycetes bacterium]|nr:hypothetical protein [Planctomycetota bacterium]
MTLWGNTLVLAGSFVTALEGTLPINRLGQLGGFLNLSGFQPRELQGQHAFAGRAIVYRQLAGTRGGLLGFPLYVGASFEAGQVADDKLRTLFDEIVYAGSVFVGVETLLGPFYLAYGQAEEGRRSAYLSLGRTF